MHLHSSHPSGTAHGSAPAAQRLHARSTQHAAPWAGEYSLNPLQSAEQWHVWRATCGAAGCGQAVGDLQQARVLPQAQVRAVHCSESSQERRVYLDQIDMVFKRLGLDKELCQKASS